MYKLTLLLIMILLPFSATAKVINIGSKSLEIPNSFNNVNDDSKSKLLASNTNNGEMLFISADTPESFNQHLTILTPLFKKIGAEINKIDCNPNCEAFYTEFIPPNKSHTKFVYFMKTETDYFQIEYVNPKPVAGRNYISSVFEKLK